MPSLLAIETSTDTCSVAVLHRGSVRETSVYSPKEHQRILLPMIEALLAEQSVTLGDLDAIVWGAGPGSFTGIRLAAAVTQGLAFAASKPVIPVSSLAAAAHQAAQQDPSHAGPLLVARDARMNEVYAGAYRLEGESLVPLAADQLLPVAALEDLAAGYSPASRRIGEGWLLLPGSAVVESAVPSARSVLQLALPEYAAGRLVAAEEALPVYLRDSVSWQKWQPKSHAFSQVQEPAKT